jgi:threonine dehydratase
VDRWVTLHTKIVAEVNSIVTLDDIRQARARLQGVAVRTELFPYIPGELYLKLESQQPIGSFKLRGAYNKVASLSPEQRSLGVITYSSGNHAQGVAYAARALGARAVIVMPNNAPQVKREATVALGAEIILVGPGSAERQQRAEELAAQHGFVVVPPYNDEKIIAGQGTMGLEILEDLPQVECILAPVGGGGMLSGIATAVKLSRPEVKVIGVEPELAGDARASFHSGEIVELPAAEVSRTLADGLRTQKIGSINFEHIRKYVDDIVSVSEAEIRETLKLFAVRAKTTAEPSGVVAAAAYLFHRDQLPTASVSVAVVSGGNIEPQLLKELRQGEPSE